MGVMAARRNEPNVHLVEELPNAQRWRGAELSVTILGNWQYYRAKIHRQAYRPPAAMPRPCVVKFSFGYEVTCLPLHAPRVVRRECDQRRPFALTNMTHTGTQP